MFPQILLIFELILQIQDAFENACKFMCAATEAERMKWVESIQLAQQNKLSRRESTSGFALSPSTT